MILAIKEARDGIDKAEATGDQMKNLMVQAYEELEASELKLGRWRADAVRLIRNANESKTEASEAIAEMENWKEEARMENEKSANLTK